MEKVDSCEPKVGMGTETGDNKEEKIEPKDVFQAYDQLDDTQKERLNAITAKIQNAGFGLDQLDKQMMEIVDATQEKLNEVKTNLRKVKVSESVESVDQAIRDMCINCCAQTDIPSKYIEDILNDIQLEQLYYSTSPIQQQQETVDDKVCIQMNRDLNDLKENISTCLIIINAWSRDSKHRIIEHVKSIFRKQK